MRIEKLKKLNLGDIAKLEDANGIKIQNLSNLETFSSYSTQSSVKPILSGLSKNLKMKNFSFNCKSLDTNDVEMIAGMKNLEYLFIRGNRIGSLTSLAALKHLRELNLLFKEIGTTDRFSLLKNMPHLEKLCIHRLKSGDFSIVHLQDHNKIKSLVIDAVLSEEDIKVLESMPELQYLRVDNSVNSKWMMTAKRRLPKVKIENIDSEH